MENQIPVTPAISTTPPPKKNNFLVVLLSILLFISLAITGFFAYQTQKLTKELVVLNNEQALIPSPTPDQIFSPELTAEQDATLDPTANWKTFTHPTDKYQFKYPSTWSASVNQSVPAGTLFGLNANSQSGIGGVEIREIPTEPQDFNKLTESKIIEQNPLIINGINGFKTKYSNIINGTNFVFRHTDGLIYNIYINSEDLEDLNIFNQILSTFKFTN